MNKNARHLGTGKARDFLSQVKPGETLVEEGDEVYAVDEASFFCPVCDGCGCRTCKWTGERKAKR